VVLTVGASTAVAVFASGGIGLGRWKLSSPFTDP